MICRSCNNDTNSIIICSDCGDKVCLKCSINELCQECYIMQGKKEELDHYYQDKYGAIL